MPTSASPEIEDQLPATATMEWSASRSSTRRAPSGWRDPKTSAAAADLSVPVDPGRNGLAHPGVLAAMTSHVALAGSALAAVALWAAVYTALLPSYAPALTDPGELTMGRTVSSDSPAQTMAAPKRWADLPREGAEDFGDPPEVESAAAGPDLPIMEPPRNDRPLSRQPTRLIHRNALPESPVERRFVRERTHTHRRAHAGMRSRRMQEPIQFSLATRSSS